MHNKDDKKVSFKITCGSFIWSCSVNDEEEKKNTRNGKNPSVGLE